MNEKKHMKLLSQIRADTVRSIFKYKHMLDITSPIRVLKTKIYKYREIIIYRTYCSTNIGFSIAFDRMGKFIALYLDEKKVPSLQKATKNGSLLDLAKLEKTSETMMQNIYNKIDYDILKTVMLDALSIGLCHNISCKGGSIKAFGHQVIYRYFLECEIKFFLYLDNLGNFMGMSLLGELDELKTLFEENLSKPYKLKVNLFNI